MSPSSIPTDLAVLLVAITLPATLYSAAMVNRILFSFVVVNGLFLGTGCLLTAVFFLARAGMAHSTVASVAANLLLMGAPLTGTYPFSYCFIVQRHSGQPLIERAHTAALVNAGLIFLTFLVSLPGMLLSTDRAWITLHGWLVLVCALFTLILGLDVWFQTLRTRVNLGVVWGGESVEVQSLLQQRVSKQYCLEELPLVVINNSSAAVATLAVRVCLSNRTFSARTHSWLRRSQDA